MMSDMDACDLSVSNKAAANVKECEGSINSNENGVDVDLGVKKQRHQESRMTMVHHDNHHRQSPLYDIAPVDGGVGPTSNIRPKNSIIGGIYNATVGVSGSTTSAVVSGLKTLQQPFYITTAAAAATQASFKFPGMAAAMGFPFTNAQWKELERQAMIYKYMMASIPVPRDLLFPITRSSPTPPWGSGLNLVRFSNGGDLEPGRCRRTDGKKWRCSRNVAPNQKYCERHLHRGRPRSRKPVELPTSNKKTRLEPNPNTFNNTNNSLTPSPSQSPGNFSQYPPHIQSTEKAATVQFLKEQRSLDWMMKEEDVQMTTSAGQEWHHHLMQQTGIDVDNPSVPNHHYLKEPVNMNSYTNFSAGEDQQGNECPLFISPDLVSLEKQTPRGFIDAWANGVSNDDRNANPCNKSSVSSGGNLSVSPLSLSMGGNNTTDEDMGQVQMGLGIVESGQDHECSAKPPFSSWLSPVSWAASTPGGPLAEVLRPSTVAASGSPSPTAGNVDSGSPPATAVASPSGVLQKTIASWSDSSGSSSPTLASSRINKPEIALLWLSQGKLESSS